MAIQGGTTMSREDRDQDAKELAEVTEHFRNTLIRTEKMIDSMLDKAIAEAREEKDLKANRQAMATECLRNTLIRTEKADERFLDDLLRRLKAEKAAQGKTE